MKKTSLLTFAVLLILWGIYLRKEDETNGRLSTKKLSVLEGEATDGSDDNSSLLQQENLDKLEKIGHVINENNVDLDQETKEQIKKERVTFDHNQSLKEKQAFLEQSFLDKSSSIKDIKRIQDDIVEMKLKLKQEPTNTEKWDPKFVFYLMIQENYTYHEVNLIKSLSENGISNDELNYISELIKEPEFMEKITSFKSQGDIGRAVASLKKKDRDEFIDDPMNDHTSVESKLIEMNYNKDEKEEMVYGNEQN